MRARFGLAVLAMALALFGCGPKPAASTGAASTSTESPQVQLDPCAGKIKALCVDSDLAPLSAKMKEALADAASKVSADGAQLLAKGQRDWLEAQRIACGVGADGAALTAKQENCLKAALAARVKDAKDAVERLGPFTFQRMEINQSDPVVETAAAQALGAAAPNVITRDIKFPRIDGDTPAIRKFNEAVKQSPRFKAIDQTEEQVTYKIAYAGPDLVSVRFDLYDLGLGAANPETTVRTVNFNMTTGAPLTANDVFAPNTRWADFLTRRALADLTAQLRADDETAQAPSPDYVRKALTAPDHWLVTNDALVIVFSPLDLGNAGAGTHEVSVSWRDLKSYLNPRGPGPIKNA
jgi:uncharacterized protein YecT (DUF1311 family)